MWEIFSIVCSIFSMLSVILGYIANSKVIDEKVKNLEKKVDGLTDVSIRLCKLETKLEMLERQKQLNLIDERSEC